MMTKPAAILFDKDGTLLDFEATYADATLAVLDTLAAGDGDRLSDLASAIGFHKDAKTFDPDSVVIAGTSADIANRLWPLVPEHPLSELAPFIDGLYANETLASLTVLNHVQPVLEALRDHGITLGLATNDAEHIARQHLTKAGLLSHFSFVAGYDSGHGAKPEPGMIRAFAAQTGRKLSDIVMVGDSLTDMRAAHGAGVRAIAVATGPADRATLEPVADTVIDTLDQLPGIFGIRFAVQPPKSA